MIGGVVIGGATSWSGFGAVGGGLIATHGAQKIVHGVENCINGETTDGYISQGIQGLGGSRDGANRTDAGIGLTATLASGAGLVGLVAKSSMPLGVAISATTTDAVVHQAKYVASGESSSTIQEQLYEAAGMSHIGAQYTSAFVNLALTGKAGFTAKNAKANLAAKPTDDSPTFRSLVDEIKGRHSEEVRQVNGHKVVRLSPEEFAEESVLNNLSNTPLSHRELIAQLGKLFPEFKFRTARGLDASNNEIANIEVSHVGTDGPRVFVYLNSSKYTLQSAARYMLAVWSLMKDA